MEGWIKLHRKLLESEIWLTKPCSWNKVWIYILSKVNHENNKFFKRGENFFNFTQEIKHIGCDVSYDNIREFLRYAKSTTMITTRKTTRGIVIKVNKYAIYQSKDEIKTTTETTSPTTIKPQQNHNDKQECKNERNNTSKSNNLKLSLPLLEVLKKELKSHKLDGDYQKQNLYPSETLYKLLLNDYRENYGKEPTPQDLYDEFEKILGLMDNFNYNNATNILYITKHWNQIINKLKK
jgi:hypothetical protein